MMAISDDFTVEVRPMTAEQRAELDLLVAAVRVVAGDPTALVVARPGFYRPGASPVCLSGRGAHAVLWMMENPDLVTRIEAGLTEDDLGRIIDLTEPR